MRKMLLLLLAATGGNAMAGWIAMDESPFGTTYVNPDTISRSSDTVKIWELIDFRQSQQHEGESFYSFTTEVEYDCARKSLQILNTAGMTGHMATGSVIAGGAGPRQWRPVTAGTAAERSWRFVCGRK